MPGHVYAVANLYGTALGTIHARARGSLTSPVCGTRLRAPATLVAKTAEIGCQRCARAVATDHPSVRRAAVERSA